MCVISEWLCNLIPVFEINVAGEAVSYQKKLDSQDLNTGQVYKIICWCNLPLSFWGIAETQQTIAPPFKAAGWDGSEYPLAARANSSAEI